MESQQEISKIETIDFTNESSKDVSETDIKELIEVLTNHNDAC